MGFYPPASLVRDGQRRGVEVLPPRREPERGEVRRSRTAPSGSASATSARSARRRPRRSPPAQPYDDVGDLAPARAGEQGGARGARRLGRLRPVRRRGASCSGRSGSSPRPHERRRRQPASSRCRSSPTADVPELPPQTDWERMLADYGLTGVSVGPHPLELLRPHLPAETLSSRELAERPGGEVAVAGPGRRAPAARDRERRRLHAARGRARPGEPDRPAAGLRAAPGARPRRAALLARGQLERSGRNLNVLVRTLEIARPARPRGRRARRGAGGAPARPPLRAPVVPAEEVDP